VIFFNTPAARAKALAPRFLLIPNFYIFIIVENRSSEADIPKICETEEEKDISIGQLKYRYLQIARQKFQGKIFINKNTQSPIRVSRDGIMEWWRKSRKREHK